MPDICKINENIYSFTTPYKDIFTTVYIIKTDKGVLLFDTASYDTDVNDYIIPVLNKLNISADELKYVFISHNHKDHAGGLEEFIKHYKNCCIISRSPELCQKYSDFSTVNPDDGSVFLDVLKIVAVPGHTIDSAAVFDTRTNTLISGDCLQLYGIFGSGKWGANINYPGQHIEAIKKLETMSIEQIFTAHNYHPLGQKYEGKSQVKQALDNCLAPLDKIKALISGNPELGDDEICALYNKCDLPTLGEHVVTAVRNMK